MNESTIDGSLVAPRPRSLLTRRIAAWPALAAAPTFAVMAIITTLPASAGLGVICGTGPMSLTGMGPMYLLMGIFHSSPWLELIGDRLNRKRAQITS